MKLLKAWLFLALGCLQIGCSTSPTNPSFALSENDARQALVEMHKTPQPLARPVVILGGYLDPGLAPAELKSIIHQTTGDGRIVTVTFANASSFDECRKRTVDAVQKAFPSDDPGQTVEVDVVAVSMGGLIARCAALEETDQRTLRIVRLFTISTPHCGADLAGLPTLSALHRDMRAGSYFLSQLNGDDSTTTYELIPYVRLGDLTVGAENAAPAGRVAWWVSNQFLSAAHGFAYADPRIQADLCRRLREETPYTTAPPAPLPGTTSALLAGE